MYTDETEEICLLLRAWFRQSQKAAEPRTSVKVSYLYGFLYWLRLIQCTLRSPNGSMLGLTGWLPEFHVWSGRVSL